MSLKTVKLRNREVNERDCFSAMHFQYEDSEDTKQANEKTHSFPVCPGYRIIKFGKYFGYLQTMLPKNHRARKKLI